MGYAPYPQTTPSNAKSLGSVPSHWEVKRGRFVVSVNPAAPTLRDLRPEDEVSFVPMEAVGEHGELSLEQTRVIADVSGGYTEFQNGDVIVAKITPCFENGKSALAEGLVNGAAYGTTELHVLRAGPMVERRFVFYTAISDTYRKLGESEMYGAGGQKRVPPEFSKDYRIPLPPLPEQQQIAAFLDWKTGQIDALMARKKELLEKLKEKRLAVITQAVTRGLNPAAPLRDSGIPWLGHVPAHWEVKRLRFATSRIEQGWSPQCENQPADEGFWGVMKVGCVNGDTFDANENKALPPELEAAANYELRAGDILISRANTRELLGSAAIVPEGTRSKLLLCDKLYRVSPAPGLRNDFLTLFLRTPVARFQYEREATGASSSMQNIAQVTIKDLPTVIPPLEEQQAICVQVRANVARLDTLLGAIEAAIARLAEYRTALITAATTGKIDVRGVKVPNPAA